MKTRIITAVVALAVFCPVLWFSHTAAFPLVIGLIAAIGGLEMTSAAGVGKNWFVALPTAVFCFLAVLAARPGQFVTLKQDTSATAVFAVLTAAYLFYMLCLCVFTFPKLSAKSLMATVGMASFVALAFHCLVLLRDFRGYDYLLVFVCAWTTDTFAIFGGKFFGKRKLAPRLSPKKTVACMVSGFVGALVGFAIVEIVLQYGFGCTPKHLLRLAVAVPASFVSQVGDLAASAIKRDCGIKDYGNLLPGHGGVVDRFDSVMFLTVAAWLFVSAARYLGVM